MISAAFILLKLFEGRIGLSFTSLYKWEMNQRINIYSCLSVSQKSVSFCRIFLPF